MRKLENIKHAPGVCIFFGLLQSIDLLLDINVTGNAEKMGIIGWWLIFKLAV